MDTKYEAFYMFYTWAVGMIIPDNNKHCCYTDKNDIIFMV